jgi:hypothetical protein
MQGNGRARPPVAGIADIQALAVTAFAALEEAGLAAEAELVRARVFSRPPEHVLGHVTVGAQTVWAFTPFVELLMLELHDVATADDESLDSRRQRVGWAVEMAGF